VYTNCYCDERVAAASICRRLHVHECESFSVNILIVAEWSWRAVSDCSRTALTGQFVVDRKAKELIGRIMSKGHDLPAEMTSDGHVTLEMMIPGNKAGIVIGKGGETIKLLQVTTPFLPRPSVKY